MCDPQEDEVKRPEIVASVSHAVTPVINVLKAKSPLWVPPVDWEMPQFIGFVAITWGFVEYAFERLLQAMQRANNSTARWRGTSFEQKSGVFKKEMMKCLGSCPHVQLHFHRVLDDALRLQKDRNLLLHGTLTLRLYTKWIEGEPTAKAIIHAERRRKDKIETGEFDEDRIETLYYDLAHVAGRLNMFGYPIRADQFLGASFHEIHLLQEFLRLHRPLQPTNPVPDAPRQSSPE